MTNNYLMSINSFLIKILRREIKLGIKYRLIFKNLVAEQTKKLKSKIIYFFSPSFKLSFRIRGGGGSVMKRSGIPEKSEKIEKVNSRF